MPPTEDNTTPWHPQVTELARLIEKDHAKRVSALQLEHHDEGFPHDGTPEEMALALRARSPGEGKGIEHFTAPMYDYVKTYAQLYTVATDQLAVFQRVWHNVSDSFSTGERGTVFQVFRYQDNKWLALSEDWQPVPEEESLLSEEQVSHFLDQVGVVMDLS